MFEKFTAANARDFSQRYQGTYGFYRHEEKPPLLCRIHVVENVVIFVDKKGIEYTLNADRPGEIGFEFLPPKSGYFNTKDGAYYVERVAARQFQRGISERNTRVFLLQLDGEFKNQGVNFVTLEKIYTNDMKKADAFQRYSKGLCGSVAISEQIALTFTHVFVLGKPVGRVKNYTPGVTKIQIQLDDSTLFRTEIIDALRGVCEVEFV